MALAAHLGLHQCALRAIALVIFRIRTCFICQAEVILINKVSQISAWRFLIRSFFYAGFYCMSFKPFWSEISMKLWSKTIYILRAACWCVQTKYRLLLTWPRFSFAYFVLSVESKSGSINQAILVLKLGLTRLNQKVWMNQESLVNPGIPGKPGFSGKPG